MPTWLAIAIPSVVAVATVLAWGIEYAKKSHEIEKLRLEIEKLKRDGAKTAREETGLYKPTAAEVDAIARQKRRQEEEDRELADGGGPTLSVLVVMLVAAVFLLYAVVRLIIDLVRFLICIF